MHALILKVVGEAAILQARALPRQLVFAARHAQQSPGPREVRHPARITRVKVEQHTGRAISANHSVRFADTKPIIANIKHIVQRAEQCLGDIRY
jgi:hypothetical protein